jgi:galactokinase
MRERGVPVRGFNAVMTSGVGSGSGLSSSAALEVLLCTLVDGLFGSGNMPAQEKAKLAQNVENTYFGKPSGLMDQMASAVGGLVTIDFKCGGAQVRPLQYDFAQKGYAIAVVNPGGDHGALTDAYAAIRDEMVQVAQCFGDSTLRTVRPEQVESNIAMLRQHVSDRAILRAMHFFDDNERVTQEVQALEADDLGRFFELVVASGNSSWRLLQNVYISADKQPLALALEMARRLLNGDGAWRVHGGGFAGTILCFVPNGKLKAFIRCMSDAFGAHACDVLDIRPMGAMEVLKNS